MYAAAVAAVQAVWPDLSRDGADVAAARFRADPTGAFRRFVAGEGSFAEMRTSRLRDIAEHLALGWPAGDVMGRFEAAYGPVFDAALAAYADTPGFLARCRDLGLPVRVLTNSSSAYTEGKVLATGLLSLEGAVCSRDCLGVGKPAPEVFRHACEELRTTPEETLYIGDEWTSDAQGAADAGLRAVWLVRGDGDPAGEVAATPERIAAAQARGIPIVTTLAAVSLTSVSST